MCCHFGGLWGHGGLQMTSEVTYDLRFELSDLNDLYSHAFLACMRWFNKTSGQSDIPHVPLPLPLQLTFCHLLTSVQGTIQNITNFFWLESWTWAIWRLYPAHGLGDETNAGRTVSMMKSGKCCKSIRPKSVSTFQHFVRITILKLFRNSNSSQATFSS